MHRAVTRIAAETLATVCSVGASSTAMALAWPSASRLARQSSGVTALPLLILILTASAKDLWAGIHRSAPLATSASGVTSSAAASLDHCPASIRFDAVAHATPRSAVRTIERQSVTMVGGQTIYVTATSAMVVSAAGAVRTVDGIATCMTPTRSPCRDSTTAAPPAVAHPGSLA